MNKSYKVVAVLVIIVVFLPLQILGFSLSDHERFSKTAIKEFFKCVQPEMLHNSNRLALNRFTNIIVDGNLQEDIYYWIKVMQYSHFYNPYFYVNFKWSYIIDRCPSNYRIYHLEQILDAYLKGDRLETSDLFWDDQCQPSSILTMVGLTESLQVPLLDNLHVLDFRLFYTNNRTQIPETYRTYFNQLGHAIHHLQDMSSPTHVVPILHPLPFDSPTSSWKTTFQDGFEHNDNRIAILNRIDAEFDDQPLNEMCAFKESTPETLFHILDQSARNTLNALDQELSIHVSKSDNRSGNRRTVVPMTVTWGNWYDKLSASSTNHIGQYGIYQDAFELTEFQISDDPRTPQNEEGWIVYVNKRFYDDFRYQQYRQVIEDTKKALYYAYLKILRLQQDSNENN